MRREHEEEEATRGERQIHLLESVDARLERIEAAGMNGDED